jgi:2,3-diaminopropionate biosynthesis protein SbnB
MIDISNLQSFHILTGEVIGEILSRSHKAIIDSVAHTYLAHEEGKTTNPDSYFLRFPQDESRRIIALPAALHGDDGISGIKWIASYPSNVTLGLQRASAVLVLNDAQTGYPLALLEGARISAARTAASAVLGAYYLNQQSRKTKTLSIIGGGYIARNIIDMFKGDGWEIDELIVCDLDSNSSAALAEFSQNKIGYTARVVSLDEALKADIITFATNAGVPYVPSSTVFMPNQIILNISLRDIAPELILESQNIFDDVSHCLKANTSPHLAEQLCGHREFVTGTIAGVIRNEVKISQNKPVIYSPFGMGILDLALGRQLLNTAISENSVVTINNFMGDMSRW